MAERYAIKEYYKEVQENLKLNLATLSDLAKYMAACPPPGQLLERFSALKDEIPASNHPKAQGYCPRTTMTHFCFPKQSTSHAMQ